MRPWLNEPQLDQLSGKNGTAKFPTIDGTRNQNSRIVHENLGCPILYS